MTNLLEPIKTIDLMSNIFTKREIEIIGLMSRGYTNKSIADKLFISDKTVEHFVFDIYSKVSDILKKDNTKKNFNMRVLSVLFYLKMKNIKEL